MQKISSSKTVFAKYGGIAIVLIVNLFLASAKGEFHGWGSFFGVNSATLLTAGMISLYAFRLWDVETNGQIVVVSRFNTRIEFRIDEIQNIEVIPNLLDQWSFLKPKETTFPPFVKIIIKEKVDGVNEFRFYPSGKNLEDKLLIDPWQKLRREKAQASLKRRGAKR